MRWITHLGGARATLGIGLALVALGEARVGLPRCSATPARTC